MATTPLSQAVLAGMDPRIYRPLSDIQQGDAMLKEGTDSSPTSKWGAIGRLANALAGSYISNSSTSDLARTIAGGKKSATDQLMEALQSQSRAIPSAPPMMAPSPTASPQPTVTPEAGSPNAQVASRFPAEWSPNVTQSTAPNGGVQTAGKIYNNDEPSPLDPPSGADRQKMVATILGEAGNEPQQGKDAVASVIRTRAVDGGYGGDTPSGVVTAPNQFEPWNTPEGRARMARAAADPKQAAAAEAAIASAYGEGGRAPEDPTEGMTHFFSPGAQAALGRKPPAWAGGESVQIGGHVFNSPDDERSVQVASNDPAAIPSTAQPAQGYAIPGAAAEGGLDAHKLLAVLQNPYSDDATKQLAQKLLLAQFTPDDKPAWGIVGKDKFGQPVYGYPPSRAEAAAQPKAATQIDPLEGLQGQERIDALKKIDPARASQTQAVLDGRVAYPTGSRLNPQQQQLKEDVTQADPNFTAATWLARSNFEKNMASTVPNSFGGQIRSAGTVAKHLGDAHEALPAIESGVLGASNTLPMLNSTKAFIRDQAGDQKYQDAIGRFKTATKGLADEVSNLLAGGHGAEGSKLYWQDRLDITKHSPTEVRGALDEFKSLMMGRVSNVAQEKDRVFGKEQGHTDPLSLFGPKERENMAKIQSDTYGAQQKAEAGAAASAPTEKTIGNKTYIKRGDQWFEK